MLRTSGDIDSMQRINHDLALRYIEAKELETRVLMRVLGFHGNAEGTSPSLATGLMQIWAACNEFDLGSWARDWIASGDCQQTATQVLDQLVNEMGMAPGTHIGGGI